MNVKTSLGVASACILSLTFSNVSNATLLTRPGGLAVYDTDLNINTCMDMHPVDGI